MEKGINTRKMIGLLEECLKLAILTLANQWIELISVDIAEFA